MAGAFESVTRVAIAEIIRNRAQESKFGWVLSGDDFERLVDDLLELLKTSRDLKSAGDRFLAKQFATARSGRIQDF